MDLAKTITLTAVSMKAVLLTAFHMDMEGLYMRMASTTMEMSSLAGKMDLEPTNLSTQHTKAVLLITWSMAKGKKKDKVPISKASTNMGKKEKELSRTKITFMRDSSTTNFLMVKEN